MANRIPLIVNASASQIQEVPSGDVVNFDNKVVLTNSTASSSKTVGAVVITGGVGISGATNIGGALNVDGDITAFASSDETLKENLVAIPNAVSKAVIHACTARNPRIRYRITWATVIMMYLKRFLTDNLFDRISSKL